MILLHGVMDGRETSCWWEVLEEARKWRVSEQEAPKGKVSERKNVLKLHHFLEAHRSETHEKNRDFVVKFSF